MNLVVVSGNLTRDPEMRYTPQGKAVTEFTVADNYGSGEQRTTEFFRCVAWEKLAETVAEYTRKGRKVLVTGRLTTDKWTDSKGTQRETMKIRASSVEFMSAPDHATEGQPAREAEDFADLKF